MKKWWKGFVARHIVADDPHPELSRLDRMDGLTDTLTGQSPIPIGSPLPAERHRDHG